MICQFVHYVRFSDHKFKRPNKCNSVLSVAYTTVANLLEVVNCKVPQPSTRRSTLGDRAFPVALARAWNSLPASVSNAPSLTTFHGIASWSLYFSVVVWRWLGDRDCTAQCNCCLPPQLLTVGASVLFGFGFGLILYGAPAMSLTW